MQPQFKQAPPQGPEHNEKVDAEVVRNTDLEQQNTGPVTQSSDNGNVREEPVSNESSTYLVTFGLDDTENPLNWPTKLKWGVTAAVSGTGFLRIMVSTVRHSLCCNRIFYQECGHGFQAWKFLLMQDSCR